MRSKCLCGVPLMLPCLGEPRFAWERRGAAVAKAGFWSEVRFDVACDAEPRYNFLLLKKFVGFLHISVPVFKCRAGVMGSNAFQS